MDHLLKKYCPRIDFDSYEDFLENFSIVVPDRFNFAYDVVDEWARAEPTKRALVWCDDNDEEKVLTQQLAGYPAYAQRVHYRLVPYVW